MSATTTTAATIELRVAAGRDAAALRRLAERDTRALPPGPHLVAVRDGSIDAAVSVATRQAVADPFRPTAELVELLRVRAAAMAGRPSGTVMPRQLRRPRAVTA